MTVFKAGFLGSGRFGSGVIVARLSDGSWSAPSAIGTFGGGFGGQIGFELTDFVFILNDASAVRTFSQQASVTLGGNVSIAAGPVGRNAEAAGAASHKGVAGVFAYSRTKGLFAGVSLEGGVLVERRDANEKLYNGKVRAKQLLEGSLPPPPAADPLMRVLSSRVFSGNLTNTDAMYNDVPIYDDSHDDVVWEGRTGEAYGQGTRTTRERASTLNAVDSYEYHDDPNAKKTNTWRDNVYDQMPTGRAPMKRASTYGSEGPGRPTAAKPVFKQSTGPVGTLRPDQAIALFTFDADQAGDLGFKKGEVITITKRTENKTDWWTGRTADGRTGIFPSNYVNAG